MGDLEFRAGTRPPVTLGAGLTPVYLNEESWPVHVAFHVVDSIPDGSAAGLMVGTAEGYLYLRRDASAEQIAEALNEIVGEWAEQEWMYVGQCNSLAERSAS